MSPSDVTITNIRGGSVVVEYLVVKADPEFGPAVAAALRDPDSPLGELARVDAERSVANSPRPTTEWRCVLSAGGGFS